MARSTSSLSTACLPNGGGAEGVPALLTLGRAAACGSGRGRAGGRHHASAASRCASGRPRRPPGAASCVRVFTDKKSGKNAEREELWKLDRLRPGDTLVVPSLDRLGRSIQDLIAIVAGLRKRGIGFLSLHESLDTTTPGGRLAFHVFAALAEFIRELIVQGTHEGLAAARARGERIGRPPAMTEEQIRHARGLLADPENTIASIAKLLGVSRTTIYKYVPELAAGRGLPHYQSWPGAARPSQLIQKGSDRKGRGRTARRHPVQRSNMHSPMRRS
ncbi:recombinase family protein [Streptomyces sp. NPDC102384]|uniref:recombinase family protein n=1 Tax=unclassified Streptomyces TaxID=2593676 RepID=UPI00381616E0